MKHQRQEGGIQLHLTPKTPNMVATALLTTLLLSLAVLRGGAICTSTAYSAYPGMDVRSVVTYPSRYANQVVACHQECNTAVGCYGYVFDSSRPDGSKCSHIFSEFDFSMVYSTGQNSRVLYRRDCPTSTRPPLTTSTTTTRRPPPPTQTPPPATSCPPADGMSTGIVVLIAVFTAIGGIIIGMLLAAKCCHIGHGGGWFGSDDHPLDCTCQKCKPVHGSPACKDPGCNSVHKPAPVSHSCSTPGCTSCHQVAPPSCIVCHIPGCTGCHPPQHPHLLHQKPGPIFPALPAPGHVTPGQTFSVAASPYNDVYSVSLPSN